MDYIGYTMNICLILFMISVTGSHCQYYSNRDIILTPHQLKTYPGKILYYRPHELPPGSGGLDNVAPAQQGTGLSVATSTAVPWEEVLKETVFLALNDNKTSAKSADGTTTNQPLYIARQQKAIYGAPYIGSVDLSVPRFGDIVELAHGRLEQENDESYLFVQDDANKPADSGHNVSAYWKVERIRHRDEQRGHRFELKFTVTPVRDLKLDENAVVNRSFIVRDEDYPRYFGMVSPNAIPMLKKNDQFIERVVFDPHFPQPHSSFTTNRYFRPTQATITLGEYLLQSLLSGGETTIKAQAPQHAYRFGSSYNRIKFPDSFTTSSQSVPKYYHHIHFQRPSIAPLAPTAPPMPPLIKEVQTASSNIQQDFAKLVDFRGAIDNYDLKPSADNNIPIQQPQLIPQPIRYPQPMIPMQPTHIHHYHHHQQAMQQQSMQPQQPQPLILSQPPNNNPPPLQPLPQNLVQSIPVFNPQGQVMLNHIPIAPSHMIQVAAPQGPVAFPVHFQLVPSQGQVYAPQQGGMNAIPIRIMQPAPVQFYPVNPFMAPQNHPDYSTTKHPNQSHHYPYHPNSIPTTLKYTSFKYTPQPSTSPYASPTVPNYRYTSLPTIQSSPAGQRERFTASSFRPVSSTPTVPTHKLEPETAGSSPVDSSAPKFQSFGLENAVTPKATTVVPIATVADQNFTPSIGHTPSHHGGFYSNFLDEKGTVSESGKLYSEPDPLYHKSIGTTPIYNTTPSSPVSPSGAFTHTSGPNFTPKFTTNSSFNKGNPSPTIGPPQIETPISSTLKSYHYLAHHDSFDFVPSRVVELAHVKKIPKKSGGKRKPQGNHHQVTVTSHKPLKFSEAPDYATRRPESQMNVQLPPPEKEFNTFYGTAKQNQKVQKPKNYVTQPYSSSTTPFPTSLTTPASSTTASTTPTPVSTTPSGSTTATTQKTFTQFQPFFKNKNEKSDDIITTMRPRLVIKTVYKPFPSSTSTISASSGPTEKPVLKWIPKRPRNKGNTSVEPSSSSTSSSASIEQMSSSSEHATADPIPANKSLPPTSIATARSSLENQMNRLRASRGRSRYTHRRATTPGTPSASQHPIAKVHRVRTSTATTTSTSTIKPVSGVTSSAFDSSRLADNRPPTDTEISQTVETPIAPISLRNIINEKSKRDTATEENEVLVAEPLTSQQSNSKENNYEMVKAEIKPVQTNSTNILLFEASDASIGPTGSSVPTFNELTMSIINHARAIANQTAKPEDLHDKTLQSNEISHTDEETTIPMSATTVPAVSTNEPSAESDETATTYGGDSTDQTDSTGSSRSETTVSVDN
ncbi:mucin-2-like [Armigeres subalbatus]|uniref:mucin-2-like n=1 Tax=Armigeres subalbatus TaxID=124917 RepID=UPI002ED0F96E